MNVEKKIAVFMQAIIDTNKKKKDLNIPGGISQELRYLLINQMTYQLI